MISSTFKIAGLTYFSTNSSYATLETDGVNEIGLKSFLGCRTGLIFGIADTSAIFEAAGRHCSEYEAFKIWVTGKAIMNEYSLSNQLDIASASDAL